MRQYQDRKNVQAKVYYKDRFYVSPRVPREEVESDEIFAKDMFAISKKVDVKVPVVVRLDGTNAQEAAEILKNANIENVIPATDLLDGAKKAVAAAKGEL